MPLVPNNAKRKLREGGVALGFGVHHLRTAAAPTLAAATGHDWLFLDNEHGAFSVSEIAQLCIASLPIGVTPLVRVCANAIDEAQNVTGNRPFRIFDQRRQVHGESEGVLFVRAVGGVVCCVRQPAPGSGQVVAFAAAHLGIKNPHQRCGDIRSRGSR